MKISKLIEMLTYIQECKGDLAVYYRPIEGFPSEVSLCRVESTTPPQKAEAEKDRIPKWIVMLV